MNEHEVIRLAGALSKCAIEELFNIGNNQPVFAGDTLSHQSAKELSDAKLTMRWEGDHVLTENGKIVLQYLKLDGASQLASKSAVNEWNKKPQMTATECAKLAIKKYKGQ